MKNQTHQKSHKTLTVSDFARRYDKTDTKTYISVAKSFLKKLSIELIRSTFYCRLPYGLGNIFIKMYKNKKPGIDFGLFKKTGLIKRYSNFHTFGNTFFFKWEKTNKFENDYLYSFNPVPDKTKREIGSRGLSQWIKECEEKNIEYITYE